MTRTRAILIGVTFAIGSASSARAHDTWLIPDFFAVAPRQTVTLGLTSGMAFPTLETGPRRERVAVAKCRLTGRMFDIADISAGPKALVFKAKLAQEGVATFWVKLPPKSIELTADKVAEYLAEIDPPPGVRREWDQMKEPKRWRESYTKHTKTFVRVGQPQADRSWSEPAGLGLEIVPEKDPTILRAGEDFPVHVLKDGAPFAGFSLNALAANETKGETHKTDSVGRAVFRLNKTDRWLLRGTDLRKSTRPDADWESDFTTLTVETKAPR